jgi:hypothetical protein
VAAVVLATRPAIPQDPAYHDMADRRTLLGIPNALNVLSNVPFAFVGAFGLAMLRRARSRPSPLVDPWTRWPYGVAFVAIVLTAFGSGYYHLAPGNARLLWDRLPIAVVCAGLVAAVVAECGGLALARRLLVPLLALAVGSVLYWSWTEGRGAGDLRPYAFVQFGSLVVLVLLLVLYPGRVPKARYFGAGLAAYGLAKVFEGADAPIFALGGVVSGHTLKHLTAAVGLGCIAWMLRARRDGPAS